MEKFRGDNFAETGKMGEAISTITKYTGQAAKSSTLNLNFYTCRLIKAVCLNISSML